MATLKLIEEDIVKEYKLAKRKANNYNTVCLSSRAAKGSVASAKNNYSTKELEWFEKFISRNKHG